MIGEDVKQVCNKTSKNVSKRQADLIADLFEGRHDEIEALKKHNISKNIYRKWLTEKVYVDELRFQVESARRQSEMIIARYAPVAAAKLVELTRSEKDEISRKACLDIIAHPMKTNTPEEKNEIVSENISPEVAGRLLAALAKESN